MPAARVYHNAAQSIADATLTALAFNSERFDTDTIHDTVTNNSRLTCKTAGVYTVAGSVEFAANATGYRSVYIRLNGTTNLAAQLAQTASAVTVSLITVATVYQLALNDYVELVVLQNSGGALNVAATGNQSPEFSMVRVAT